MNIFRHDHFLPALMKDADGSTMQVRLREVSPFLNEIHERTHGKYTEKKPQAILFVHGAVIPSILFDIPVLEYSWQEYFARQGYHTYALDFRGYGRSSKPRAMENPLGESKFLCGHTDALSDILTVVEEIQRRLNVSTVNLCGLSWGGLLSSKFTNLYPQLVENLILLGPVYAVQNPAWSLFMDPKNPNTLHPGIGGYRYLGEDSLFLMWDSEIPHGDKSLWQDPLVKEAIITELLQADEEWSSKHNMRSFRSPTGVIKDIEEVYNKRPLFDPKLIECPTLIVRGDYDKASLKEDTDELFKQLGAQRKYYITLGNMTHYALAERRCGEVMACVRNFLSDEGMRWK